MAVGEKSTDTIEGEWSPILDEEELEQTPTEDEPEPGPQPVEGQGAVSAFPEEWRREFEGLAYLGHLECEVKIPNHRFVLRTLHPGEKIEINQICADLEGTFGWQRAFKSCCVAAALESVDGQPIMVASKRVSAIRQKYEYVVNNWYDPVIDRLYDELDRLESKALRVTQELGINSQDG